MDATGATHGQRQASESPQPSGQRSIWASADPAMLQEGADAEGNPEAAMSPGQAVASILGTQNTQDEEWLGSEGPGLLAQFELRDTEPDPSQQLGSQQHAPAASGRTTSQGQPGLLAMLEGSEPQEPLMASQGLAAPVQPRGSQGLRVGQMPEPSEPDSAYTFSQPGLLAMLEGSEAQTALENRASAAPSHIQSAHPSTRGSAAPSRAVPAMDDDLMLDAEDFENDLRAFQAAQDIQDELLDELEGIPAPARRPAGPAARPPLSRPPVAPVRPAAQPHGGRPAVAAAGIVRGAAANRAGAVEAHIDALFEEDAEAVLAAAEQAVEDAPVQEELGPAATVARQRPCLLACEIQGECLPVTCASGVRVYCGVAPAPVAVVAGGVAAEGPTRRQRVNLLSKPITQLLADVNEARTQAAIEESRRTAAQLAAAQAQLAALTAAGERGSPEAQGALDMEPLPRQTSARGVAQGAEEQTESKLWVSKYAPHKFMSLLSDEQTNRQVCQWVKSWDACVFGRTVGPATTHAQQVTGKRSLGASVAGAAGGRGWQKGQGSGRDGAGSRKEADNRPEKKVILLCGPPGLGKTTLAHVVAAHCGYNPYEINASDDRTAAKLTERVNDAVQMQPVLGVRKPNLVIIDEIDGATGGAEGHSAISALMAIINAGNSGKDECSEAQKKAEAAGKAKRRRGRQQTPLMRPIICIANDLYAPALRPLRDVALVFHFKAPDVNKLVDRLALICQQEKVNIDRAALFTLVERSDCDIRTCLNTLQFLANQASGHARLSPTPGQAITSPPSRAGQRRRSGTASARITAHQIEKLGIGSKDAHRSVFGIWEALLQLPRHLAGAGGAAGGGRGRWLRELYSLLQDHGEYELIMSGLQENLMSVRYLDVHLKHTATMMDALLDADTLLNQCRRRGEYFLFQYVPARLLQVHLLAAQPEKPHLQWPKAQSECARQLQAHEEILHTWAGFKVAGRVLQAHPVHTLLTEMVPALVRLLSPSLRPLVPNLLSPAERHTLSSTVSLMCDFGVRYSLEDDTGPAWANKQQTKQGAAPLSRPVPLDPPLDTLQTLPTSSTGLRASSLAPPVPVKPVPLVLRQMLNQQATLETIRRVEQAKGHGEATGGVEAFEDMDTDAGARGPATSGAMGPPPPRGPQGQSGAGRIGGAGARRPLHSTDQNLPNPTGVTKPVAKKQPLNWLDAIRQREVNKRKAQSSALRNQQQEGGGEGSSDGPFSPQSKHQFPVLYRYKEGYTNAVKRPLLMKELL